VLGFFRTTFSKSLSYSSYWINCSAHLANTPRTSELLKIQSVGIAFFKISSYEVERFYDWNEELLIGELNSEVNFAFSQVARRYRYSIAANVPSSQDRQQEVT